MIRIDSYRRKILINEFAPIMYATTQMGVSYKKVERLLDLLFEGIEKDKNKEEIKDEFVGLLKHFSKIQGKGKKRGKPLIAIK